MNIRNKDQIIEILKSKSTKVQYSSRVVDPPQTPTGRPNRTYGAAFQNAAARNEGYTVIRLEITYKHNEPLIIPDPPTKAEDPFNPDAVDVEDKPQKTCKECGHPGNLVVYLECPSHGKFEE